MDDRQKAMDKVRKLLALARGKGATADEAAAAAAAATALMLKHDIDEAVLGEVGEDEWSGHETVATEHKAEKWRSALIGGLGTMHGVFAYIAVTYSGKNMVRVVGRKRDVERVRVLYEHLAAEVWRIALAELDNTTLRYHYALGMTDTIIYRLVKAKREAEDKARAEHSGAALMRVEGMLEAQRARLDEARARAVGDGPPMREAATTKETVTRDLGRLRGFTVALPDGDEGPSKRRLP